MPSSNHENVRWSVRVGEGSTRSEKVQGEFASSMLKGVGQRCAGTRSAEADGSE